MYAHRLRLYRMQFSEAYVLRGNYYLLKKNIYEILVVSQTGESLELDKII